MKLPTELNIRPAQAPKTELRISITPTSFRERLNSHFTKALTEEPTQDPGTKIEIACENFITQSETPRYQTSESQLSGCQKIMRRESFSQLAPYFQHLIQQQAEAHSSQTSEKQQTSAPHAQTFSSATPLTARQSRPRSSYSFGLEPTRHNSRRRPKSKSKTQRPPAPLKPSTHPIHGSKRSREAALSFKPQTSLKISTSSNTRMSRSSSLPYSLSLATAQSYHHNRPNLSRLNLLAQHSTATPHLHSSLTGDAKTLSSDTAELSSSQVVSSLNRVMATMTPRAGHAGKSLAQKIAFGAAMPKINGLLSAPVFNQVQAIADDDLEQDMKHLLMNA